MNHTSLNEETLRGKWNQVKGSVKEQFGQLTDDELMKAEGSSERMIGLLQERYGYSKEKAQSEWDKFRNRFDTSLLDDQESSEGNVNAETITQQAQKVTKDVLDQGKQAIGNTLDEIKKRADSAVTEQKQQAAQKLENVAGALRSSSDELRKSELSTFADYANSAADYVDDFSHFLSNRNPLELWGEVQTFARRQPEIFVLGTLAAGFLLGRFLRSSGSTSTQRSYSGQNRYVPYQQASAKRSSRRNAPEGQDIYIQGTTDKSYGDWQRYASEGGTQQRNTPTTATFATPTRPEDRPEMNERS